MLESKLEQKLIAHIKKLGGIAYKFTSPNRRGVPDRLCVCPTDVCFLLKLKHLINNLLICNSMSIMFCGHWVMLSLLLIARIK